MGLLRRADALGMGLDAYERDPHEDAESREEVVGILRGEHKEAHEQFMCYRAEVGLPDNPLKKSARKPA